MLNKSVSGNGLKDQTRPTSSLLDEFISTYRIWRYLLYSAFLKILLRNAGSKLGLLWEPLSTIIVSSVLAAVWIKILAIDDDPLEYFFYVYVGMVVWAWLSGAVSNLCASLIKNARSITARNIPVLAYIIEDVLLSFLPFILSLPILAIVAVASNGEFGIIELGLFFLAIALILVSSFAFALSIGLFAFFVGDVRQVVASVMRLGFLVTPVIWKLDRLGEYQKYIVLNPFYGYLEIMRAAVLGTKVSLLALGQSLVITFVLSFVAVVSYLMLRKRIQARALVL